MRRFSTTSPISARRLNGTPPCRMHDSSRASRDARARSSGWCRGSWGVTSALTYRTIEVDRPRRLLLVAETSTVASRDEITLTEIADGGTAVTYSADLRLRGALRLFDPLLGVFFSRLGNNAAPRDGSAACATARARAP